MFHAAGALLLEAADDAPEVDDALVEPEDELLPELPAPEPALEDPAFEELLLSKTELMSGRPLFKAANT
jgi:hypothetical protein